jgi:hypothetical protein
MRWRAEVKCAVFWSSVILQRIAASRVPDTSICPRRSSRLFERRIARSEPEGVSIVMEDYVVEVWVVERNGSPLPFAFFRPTSGIKFLLGSIDFY